MNFVDPSGLNAVSPGTTFGGSGILWTVWFGNSNDGYRIVFQWFELHGGPHSGDTGDPQNTSVEVPLPDVDAGITGLLNNPNCANFVTNLINATAATTKNPAHSDNGLTVYGMIRGIVFEQQWSRGVKVPGSVGGRISTHNATINISPVPVSSFAGASLHRETQLGYLMVGLHETIHQAGQLRRYSDAELAQAAYDLMSPERRAASKLPNAGDMFANSGFWGDELKRHCKPTGR